MRNRKINGISFVRIPLINLSSHGGVRILVELANAFSRENFQVQLLIPPGKNNSVYQLDGSVKVREIGLSVGLKFLDYAFFLLILPFYLRGGLVVANFFVTYVPCRLGAFFWRTPYLYFVQDIESKYSGLTGRILNQICEFSYRSKRIVAANNYLANTLKKQGAQVYETIGIGPTELFYKMPLPGGERPYRIMYMSRSEPWKRLDRFEEICDILSEIPKSSILCVGQDEEILHLFAKRGFSTSKPKDDAELVACFDQTQTFLLTSDREGFGLPPLEAMARGVPVVSFRCGGPDLFIKDGENSFLVDDVQQAADQIRALLGNAQEHDRFSRSARTTSEKFKLSEGLLKFIDCAKSEMEHP